MKRYFYSNKPNYSNKVVVEYIPCEKENCDMCNSMNGFLNMKGSNEIPENQFNQLQGLCSSNLNRHLKTGKHWKYVNAIYTD